MLRWLVDFSLRFHGVVITLGLVALGYGVYTASLGRGDTYTLDATEGVRWGRITMQTFGKTTESAVALAEQVRDSLVGIRLTITGHSCDPIRAELDPQIIRDPDVGGVVGVTATYVFTATKE